MWNQLAPCGLQPGPLTFSCMTVTLHTGEALVLIHSHANSEKARVCFNDVTFKAFLKGCARRHLLRLDGCAQRVVVSVHFFVIAGNFSYESVLVDNGNTFFAVSCKLSCRSCTLVWVRDSHRQTTATSPNKLVCRDVLALMDRVSLVNGLGRCHCWHPKRDLAKCVDTRGSLQRHTLGDAVQSGFRGFHSCSKLNRCRRAEQHGSPPRFCDDPSLARVPYQCQESRSPVHQQLPRSRL